MTLRVWVLVAAAVVLLGVGAVTGAESMNEIVRAQEQKYPFEAPGETALDLEPGSFLLHEHLAYRLRVKENGVNLGATDASVTGPAGPVELAPARNKHTSWGGAGGAWTSFGRFEVKEAGRYRIRVSPPDGARQGILVQGPPHPIEDPLKFRFLRALAVLLAGCLLLLVAIILGVLHLARHRGSRAPGRATHP
jgi:hypothetical protein